MIFASSAISSDLFCNRPAVSISATSAPSSLARFTVSNATPAASAPCVDETNEAPARSDQIFNCSIAAARKVSAAPITTFAPALVRLFASLPIVVVLPEPLTPITSTMRGLGSCVRSSSASRGFRMRATSPASASRASVAAILFAEALIRQRARDPRGRRGAHVGGNQRFLEFTQRRCVELFLREDRREAVRQLRRRFPQAVEQAFGLGLLFAAASSCRTVPRSCRHANQVRAVMMREAQTLKRAPAPPPSRARWE